MSRNISVNGKAIIYKLLLLIYLVTFGLLSSADDIVVTLDRDRPPIVGSGLVQQSYILTEVSNARATLVLFRGGGGKLRVSDNQLDINTQNFLVRTRHLLAARGFNTAVIDAATDFQAISGGLRGKRISFEHMSDVAHVVGDLKFRYPGVPIWLVGNGRGTIAAALAAAVLPYPYSVDGLVLTTSLTRPNSSYSDTVLTTPLEIITVPTLIMHHEKDTCIVTVPTDVKQIAQRLNDGAAPKVSVKMVDGGLPRLTDECKALSNHGFFGIEHKVTKKIAEWINKQVD